MHGLKVEWISFKFMIRLDSFDFVLWLTTDFVIYITLQTLVYSRVDMLRKQ